MCPWETACALGPVMVSSSLAGLILTPDHAALPKRQELGARGPDPHQGEEVCLELSEGLPGSPSPHSILSGSDSHSNSLFFFCVSSFSLLDLSLSFWTVGKIIFKHCLLFNSLLPDFFLFLFFVCLFVSCTSMRSDVGWRARKIKIKVASEDPPLPYLLIQIFQLNWFLLYSSLNLTL